MGKVLLEVYYIYFENETRGNYDDIQLKKMSEKVVFEFLRDYDICPTLVSKGVAFKVCTTCIESTQQVYQQTALDIVQNAGMEIGTKSIGKVFTFLKFLDLLVKFAKASYQNYDSSHSQNIILAEMICLLLERMELSKGFLNFEKRTYRPHTSKLTLLPSKSIIQQIQHAKSQAFEGGFTFEEPIVSHRQRTITLTNRSHKQSVDTVLNKDLLSI